MNRPGVDVTLLDTPSPVSLPTDSGVAFIAGTSDMGSAIAPKLVHSVNEFVTYFGARQSYSILYDAVEVFFREGGYAAYIARVVGPAPTYGSRTLLDGSAGNSLVVTAIGPGSWSANYKVAVVAGVAGGTYKIQITDSANNVLEDSGDLTTQTDAVNWSQGSSYVRIALGASSLVPAVAAATAMSAGSDDRASITDTQWNNAYNLFSPDLGPGQVFGPGRTTDTGHAQLITHAANNNRVALIDLPNSGTAGTLKTSVAAARSRYAACFAPWPVYPPTVTGTSSNRTVPPSAFIAGLIARNDPAVGPNHASAGLKYGGSRFAIDTSQAEFDTATRKDLNDNGVNVIRRYRGAIVNYGWRSSTNPATDSKWLDFGNSRLIMQLEAEFAEAGENYLFEEIDGQNGVTINGFHDALVGVCMEHYQRGELFGDDAASAFVVDTGPGVNTLQTIAANELHAIVSVKPSQMAEYISIQVVKRAVTEVL